MRRPATSEAAEPAALVEALLRPRAVALIGASDDGRKVSGRPLRYLRRHGFAGPVYPVNPKRERVQGETAYPDLASLPGPVDHALVLTPTEGAVGAVEACAGAGISLVTVLAGGFAEAGRAGARLQARLLDAARAGGVRVLGPNSIGIIGPRNGLALSANAALEIDRLIPGPVAVLSQSGGVVGSLLSRGLGRGLGFSALVSVGNEADLGVGEIGAALVGDPETEVFLLFLESLRRPDEIARFAALAGRAGKPIVAYKIGRSDAGQQAALSHTGALVGSDRAADAFLAAMGILRVDQFEALLEVAPLVVGRRPRDGGGKRVAVVTTTGGGGAMMADRLGALGLEVRGADLPTVELLAARGVSVEAGPMVDLTLAGARPEAMGAALDTLLAAGDVDAVVTVVGSSAQFHPELVVRAILDRAGAAKPLAVLLMPEAGDALKLLVGAGVAAFRTPEACAEGMRAVLEWRAPYAPAAAAGDVAGAEAVLAGTKDSVLDAAVSLDLFAALGIPVTPSIVVPAGEAPPEALPFPFPVAAKLLSGRIAHKTEAGGVVLDIADGAGLEEAVAALLARAGRGARGVLVQPMETGLGEALVGYRLDEQAGPVVTLGSGGVLAEIYDDVAVRLAPVDRDGARAMIDEVKGLAVVRGYRSLPLGDLEALAGAVADLSRLAELGARTVREAEINPLIVKPAGAGVVAVDGLVRLDPVRESP